MSWIHYHRGTIPPYRAGFLLQAIFKFKKHPLGKVSPRCLYINEKENLDWSWDQKNMFYFWEESQKVLESKTKFKKYCDLIDSEALKVLKYTKKFKKFNLKKYSDSGLLKLFSKLEEVCLYINFVMISDIDAFDLFFFDWFRIKIIKELSANFSSSEIKDIYKNLTKPVPQSYIKRQELMLKQLVKQKTPFYLASQKLYDNFWWTSLGWESIRPHSLKYFKNLLKKEKQRLHSKLIPNYDFDVLGNNLRNRQQLFKKFNLSSNVKNLLVVMDKYTYYHDLRKEIQVKTIYSFHLILREVVHRFHYKINDLEQLWFKEFKNLLRGKKIDQNKIQRRKNCVVSIVSFGKFIFWSGPEALRIKKQNIFNNKIRKKNLLGIGVTPDLVVQGHVKVCAGAKEALTKIKKGDILVCPMTLPDYLSAIKKAKAIITDEGGITCHAAIISRELDIPCIVGTKIATQVLHDGDLVEINIKKGTIKLF